MSDKERWGQLKKDILERYQMENLRLNKLKENKDMDSEYKQFIQHGIQSNMGTILKVMSDMEKLDASMRGIVEKELDRLNKEATQ